MKKIINLITIAAILVLTSGAESRSIAPLICDKGLKECSMCSGCIDQNATCDCDQCPSVCHKILLHEKKGTLYIFGEGTIFTCKEGDVPTIAYPEQLAMGGPTYWTCKPAK